MYRPTRKSELYNSDREAIEAMYNVDDDGNPSEIKYVKIIWKSMSRQQQKYGNPSRWSLMTRLDENDPWTEEGHLITCTECGEIFPAIIGNVYDTADNCPKCNAQWWD